MKLPSLLIAVLTLATLSGCGMQEAKIPKSTLRVVELKLGDHRIFAEVAESPDAQQTGLMYRHEMPADQGMLFLLGPPRQASFWMKNTYLPLSIAYIDPDGVILEIHDMQPLTTTPVPSLSPNVSYALETNLGWFTGKNIQPGQKIEGIPR